MIYFQIYLNFPFFFFFNDTATTEIYTLSLHDALPISTRRLRDAGLPCRVIVLTSFADDRRVRDALQAGAIGYLLKDVLRPELVQAIRSASQGLPALHPVAQQHLIRHVAAP